MPILHLHSVCNETQISASETSNCSFSILRPFASHILMKVGLPTAFQEKSMFLIKNGMLTCHLQESSSKARKHCLHLNFLVSFLLFGSLETYDFTFQLQAMFPVCTFYESLYSVDCVKATQCASRLLFPKLCLHFKVPEAEIVPAWCVLIYIT